MPRLVLEGVRVHGVEEEAAPLGEGLELGRSLRLVPGDVQGDAGGHPHQAMDDLAVLELLEDVPRLAGTSKPGEARAPRAHAPGGDGHPEGHGPLGQPLDVGPAPGELPAEVGIVLLEPGEPLAVPFRDLRVADHEAHRSP